MQLADQQLAGWNSKIIRNFDCWKLSWEEVKYWPVSLEIASPGRSYSRDDSVPVGKLGRE